MPAGGGRRRTVKMFRHRVACFKRRIWRIHALRRAGVKTAPLTRAAGAPMITYGVDIVGPLPTVVGSILSNNILVLEGLEYGGLIDPSPRIRPHVIGDPSLRMKTKLPSSARSMMVSSFLVV